MNAVNPPDVTIVPSGRPPNVPVTASAPSLLMIVSVCPGLPATLPPVRFGVAPPRLTMPVTLVWSYPVPAVVYGAASSTS